ncbi:MAG: carboxypeptidase M32 [Phycisphaerales bacterium]|nr:carboxypeptidase M32 [Phycisphaerales bacterium]
MAQQPAAYDQLVQHLRQAALFESVGSLLSWDQETYMPPAAAEHRAEQAAAISTLTHERMTAPKLGELLAACERDSALTGDAASPVARNLREIRRDYDRDTKLPTELVAELAKVGSQSQEVWKEARAKSDFAMFRPWLERMMALTRRKAECLRTSSHGELYDALLDTYEPGASAAEIDAVFTPLAERLSALVSELGKAGRHPAAAVLNVPFDHDRQHAMAQLVLRTMGFDFESGRLDVTTHPFCSGMAPGDTRLTTRYKDQTWTNSLYSSMHEGGHGLYEQGLPKLGPAAGTPLSQAISLGIHESQSRMWENFVGRSREFWSWLMPHAKTFAGSSLEAFTADDAFKAVNQAKPSLIRVDADEATYNLHVLIRFRLERAIIKGDLPIKDIPGEWNAAYKKYLGVDVPSDKVGCLQDVHWSFGLIGYFPTYTLGNLYAAQLWETINTQIPNLPSLISRGEFGELKTWLNTNIHTHGRRYLAGELCQKLTGKPLSAEPLIRYLEGKLRPIYR